MLLSPLGARAQGPAFLVKDINTHELYTHDSGLGVPDSMVAFDGKVFFPVTDRQAGPGLWRSDGTAAGTVRVKDGLIGEPWTIGPARAGGLTVVGDALFFVVGFDSGEGSELWKIDGTDAAPVRVFKASADAALNGLWGVDGTLFFLISKTRGAAQGVGAELWKSDGTEAGTLRLRDFPTAPSDSLQGVGASALGGTLFFTLNDGGGFDLWKSNATPEGTVRVTNISGYFATLVSDGSATLFLLVFGDYRSVTLWRSDGTTEGTTLITDQIRGGSLTVMNGMLFFDGFDEGCGTELWTSDGTPQGTHRVADIMRGVGDSYPTAMVAAGGTLMFIAADEDGEGLWESDGSESGTHLVMRLSVGWLPLTDAGGTVYFPLDEPGTGIELWRSDGTALGTAMVKDIRPGSIGSSPTMLTNVDGTLFFFADDGRSGWELWKSDGSEAGTVRVTDLLGETLSSNPMALTDVDGTLFFVADDGNSGGELWRSDGTAAGTRLIKNINARPGASALPSFPGCLPDCDMPRLLAMNGILFFAADDGSSGEELWRSDGTAEGTFRVKDIHDGLEGSHPFGLTDWNGTLYFWADDGQGYELWKSDGTATGTAKVDDINPRSHASLPGFWPPPQLTEMNGNLYFAADDGCSGRELWKTDGTAAGTMQVADVAVGGGSSNPAELTTAGGMLYFVSGPSGYGDELWKTDGTAAGTRRIDGVYSPASLIDLDGLLLFTGKDQGAHWGVWRSDGTAAGTQRIADADLIPDLYWSTRTRFNDEVFFIGADARGVIQLWRTDGIGTVAVKDLAESPLTDWRDFGVIGGELLFSVNGQIWRSDGSDAGTVPIQQIGSPGPFSNGFTRAGDHVFFTADGGAGAELWAMSLDAPQCGGDCDGDGTVTVAELVTGVSIALGTRPIAACESLDVGGDGRVTVDEALAAVHHALRGCAGSNGSSRRHQDIKRSGSAVPPDRKPPLPPLLGALGVLVVRIA